MKIVAIGAGSYVFGPSLLAQTYLEQKLNNVELALVDPDIETIELVAAVGRRMAREQGLSTTITAHANRTDALSGADFVICTASPQMQMRNGIDREIIEKYIPQHIQTEFGGIAGISYSLRQISLIDAITIDMAKLCPEAWLLNISNPLPRVCQAASQNHIKTAGFCVVSLSGYAMVNQLMNDQWLDYPYASAREKWKITSAGLNHFAWVVDLRDRATDADLLPILREKATEHNSSSNPISLSFLREIGYMLVPGDDHTRDFLPQTGTENVSAHDPWHGSKGQRQERHNVLTQIADGKESWDQILQSEAWEKPLKFIDALAGGPQAQFHAMNLLNNNLQITNLPQNIFVETPCEVSNGVVSYTQITLPNKVVTLCEKTAHITDTIVRAATAKSRALVHEAVELDPTISDKSAGIAAIDACLAAHEDIISAYS